MVPTRPEFVEILSPRGFFLVSVLTAFILLEVAQLWLEVCSALDFRSLLILFLYLRAYVVLYVIYSMSELMFPSLTGTKPESLFGEVGQMHLLQCKMA